ncbi:MAG: hypothetical protein WA790_05660 [Sulfitobacter sp.]
MEKPLPKGSEYLTGGFFGTPAVSGIKAHAFAGLGEVGDCRQLEKIARARPLFEIVKE